MILSRVEAVSFVSFYIVEPPVFHRPLFEQLSQSLALIVDCVLRLSSNPLKRLIVFHSLIAFLLTLPYYGEFLATSGRLYSSDFKAPSPLGDT